MTKSQLHIAIVHHAEDTPADSGYQPLRYGRLAEDLLAAGHRVTRVSPTFSHFRKSQRKAGSLESSEGQHHFVETTGYSSSFDPLRIKFFGQLIRGGSRFIRDNRNDIDVAILGVPPPGVVGATRRMAPEIPIIADVRDLWPEAFAVGKVARLMPIAKIGGFALSQELRMADVITAVTPDMLAWAPDLDAKANVVPLGMASRQVDWSAVPTADAPLRMCFLSNHSHGFDFGPMFDAWSRYIESLDRTGPEQPKITFVGASPTDPIQLAHAEAEPTIELLGRVMPTEVAPILNTADIGLSPSTPEWEHSMGNKVFDYLALGLFVVHSISREATKEIDSQGLGTYCKHDANEWFETIQGLHSRRQELRSTRGERIGAADQLFGRAATTTKFMGLIDQAIDTRQRR